MTLLPRKLSVQQGTTAAPVKTPAEDWRLNDGALWTPGSGSQLQERSGVVAGTGPSVGVEPLAVTAAAGGVFTVQPGRFFVQGSSPLQGGYLGTIDQSTVRTIAGSDLPAGGSYKAGYLGIKVYDQVYGDTQDGADVIYLLGASAATVNATAAPQLPSGFLELRAFTIDSTGTVTFGSYLPPLTVPRGGVLPVRATDAGNGAYLDQYRGHATRGLERWDGTKWSDPLPQAAWTDDFSSTNYSYPLTVGLGNPPNMATRSLTLAPGRTLEVDLTITQVVLGVSSTAYLQLFQWVGGTSGAPGDAALWSTGSGPGGMSVQGRLNSSYTNTTTTDQTVQYSVAGACSAGACVLSSSSGNGIVRLRHRII